MASNAPKALNGLGQSLWLDNITRDLLDSGTLKRYIDELSVTGLTSNPTIFDNAISRSAWYDAEIRRQLSLGAKGEDLFFILAIQDLSRAADLFLPVYEATGTVDGFVSLEVSPVFAYDTKATVDQAATLHKQANKPNLFIKIPGTPEGLPAIEDAIFAGVPVNVTLLFSTDQYIAAAEAYMKGLERRVDAGLSADAWKGLTPAQQGFVAETGGLEAASIEALAKVSAAAGTGPAALFETLQKWAASPQTGRHAPNLADLRLACLNLLPEITDRVGVFEKQFGRLSALERARIDALAAESDEAWAEAKGAWLRAARASAEAGSGRVGDFSRAVIFRHIAALADRHPYIEDGEDDDAVSFYLRRASEADPEHIPTMLARIARYRSISRDQDWHRVAEEAVALRAAMLREVPHVLLFTPQRRLLWIGLAAGLCLIGLLRSARFLLALVLLVRPTGLFGAAA